MNYRIIKEHIVGETDTYYIQYLGKSFWTRKPKWKYCYKYYHNWAGSSKNIVSFKTLSEAETRLEDYCNKRDALEVVREVECRCLN